MKVSLMTPTKKRETFLLDLYELIQKQTHTDFEWLICDSSPEPSIHFSKHDDNRIRYIYLDEEMSIGSKRNLMIDQAQGEVIFHFDDDDFYAPDYITKVLFLLRDHDFFSVNSWFSYDTKNHEHYYFATNHPSQTHFILEGLSGARVREIDFGPLQRLERSLAAERHGYGFTFAYRKKITHKCRFPDLDIGEDRNFFEQVEKEGYRIISIADQSGMAVKMVHDNNISKVYPQYRLPSFLAEKQLPAFKAYLERLEN